MWRSLIDWLGPDKAIVMVRHLLTEAVHFGLPTRDAAIAQEYLEHAEWGLAFEHIVTQLFEYATPLTLDFYEQAEACAESMGLAPETHSFLLLLVKG